MSDLITNVTDSTFESEVVRASTPVLVDFWAAWCGPCKMLAPVLDGIAAEYGNRLKVVKVNVDENPATPGNLGVMSIPTLVIYSNGEVKGKSVGLKSASELKSFIDSNM